MNLFSSWRRHVRAIILVLSLAGVLSLAVWNATAASDLVVYLPITLHPNSPAALLPAQSGGTVQPLRADLAIAGTARLVSGQIVYDLSIRNNGPALAQNVVVRSTLPGQLGLISTSPARGTCAANGQALTCSLGNLAASDVVAVQIVASLRTTGSQEVRTTATVGSDTSDPVDENNSVMMALQVP